MALGESATWKNKAKKGVREDWDRVFDENKWHVLDATHI